MPKFFLRKQLPILLIVFAVGLVAWRGEQAAQPKAPLTVTDTVPTEKKIKDFDDALKELDKGQTEMGKNLKNFKIPEPPVPPTPPIVNVEKMKADIEKSMKEIDVEKIKAEVQEAMKEVDAAKIKADVQASLAKIDWDKMKADIEKAKTIDRPKIEAELKNIRPQIEKSMQEAKKGIEKARKELESYKGFVDNLDKDGLINKKELYTIEHKNGTLIINGKTQPAEIYNKYRSFLESHKTFTLKKDKEGLNINKEQ